MDMNPKELEITEECDDTRWNDIEVAIVRRDKILSDLEDVILKNHMDAECNAYIVAEMLYSAYENYCETIKKLAPNVATTATKA